MNFYKPEQKAKITADEVDTLFNELYQKAVEEPVQEPVQEPVVKKKEKNKVWSAIWDFIGFFTYKPIFALADKLNENIKSKIACYLLAVLGYASLILFIIF